MLSTEIGKSAQRIGLFIYREGGREDQFCFVYVKFDMCLGNPVGMMNRHITEV